MKSFEQKRQKEHKTILFTSLLVVILLAFNTFAFYNATSLIKQMQKENEWNYVESVLTENEQKSEIQATYIKEEIVQDISNTYSDNTKLKYDLDNFNNQNDLAKILNNRLSNRYINENNDNNDLFIISTWQDSQSIDLKGRVIYDKSINCSSNGEIRDFARELSQHYNYELGYNAINRILQNNKEKPIFWEYLSSSNSNHIKLSDCSIDGLKEVYIKEGIEGLKTYEILNPVYIQDKSDILGNDKITSDGKNNTENRQLVVIQGFNLWEALKTNHNTNILSSQKGYENISNMVQVVGIFGDILIFVIFLSIVKVQNLAIELEDLGDETKKNKKNIK
jgi:hypothetical protein